MQKSSKKIRTLLLVALGFAALFALAASMAHAQYYHGHRHYHGPRHHHHHHGPVYVAPYRYYSGHGVGSILGGVADIIAATRPAPSPVVVSPVVPTPVVVEQVVPANPVVIERTTYVETPAANGQDAFSTRLGAFFIIQKMRIPGYRFTAARLTSDPIEGSPLAGLGLVKGDVITRVNEVPADDLAVLDRFTGEVPIRYIKTGTIRVLSQNVFLPAAGGGSGSEMEVAP